MMRWWLFVVAGVGALAVVTGGPFLVWLALTSLDMGGPPRPPDRFDHGTFSTFGIAMLQTMLTMTIIIIAVTGFMGYQAIKSAAEQKAESVATNRVDEELKRRFGTEEAGKQPSPPAPPPREDDPAMAAPGTMEMEDEADAPS